MVAYLRAVREIYLQQWRVNTRGGADFFNVVTSIPTVAALAWIGQQSGRNSVATYLIVGLFFMVLWYQSILGPRWAILEEVFDGTLEHSLVSRTPFMLLIFAKTLAHTVGGIRPGLIALVIALLVIQRPPEVANGVGLLMAILATLTGVTITSLLIAPLTVLALSAVTAIRIIVVVFSGFLYPVALMPEALQPLARLFPTSWAMDGVLAAIRGDPVAELAFPVAISLCISSVYLALTGYLFGIVERRSRRTGSLVNQQ